MFRHTTFMLFMVFANRGASGVQLRLTPGPYKGLLEVFHNGFWGTVCDDYFGNNEADVACRHLGFNTTNNVHYDESGSGPIWIRYIGCYGNETILDECNGLRLETVSGCSHSEDIGLGCLNSDQALVKVSSSNRVAIEGESTVSLSCSVYRRFGFQRKWTLNGRNTTFSWSSFSLTANRSLTGNWTCLAYDFRGKVMESDSVMIDILYPPLDYTERTEYAQVGDSLNLSLAVSNPLPHIYRWKKTGLHSNFVVISAPPELHNIQIKDTGEYITEVENEMVVPGRAAIRGHGIELVKILIPYPPSISCKHEISVNVNEAVNLTCTVDSSPRPHLITWSFFANSSRTIQTGLNTTFHIQQVQPSDSGVYTCTAINTMIDATGNTKNGVDTCDVKLTIKTKGDPHATDPNATDPSAEDQDSQLSTTVILYAVTGVLVALVLGLVVALVIVVIRRKTKKETGLPTRTEMHNMGQTNDEHDYDAITPRVFRK